MISSCDDDTTKPILLFIVVILSVVVVFLAGTLCATGARRQKTPQDEERGPFLGKEEGSGD